MQRRIARLVGNAFRIHGGDELFSRDSGQLFTVHMKDVGILPVTSAPRVNLLGRNSWNLAQQLIQYARVLMSALLLFFQTRQLQVQPGALPFTQSIVRSVDEVAIKP